MTSLRLRDKDAFIAIWFAAINVAAFIAFGFDKWLAMKLKWRIRESTLLMLGALGGWPGGLLGMLVFRHETAKFSFKLKYALALVPFAGEVWFWLHSR